MAKRVGWKRDEQDAPLVGDGHALLIGVDDYHALDVSLGNASGASDLTGSVNSVRTLYAMCREQWGVPAGNIRVLTSPPIDAGTLEAGDDKPFTGEATERAIVREVERLAEATGDGAPGLLSFTGHGAWVGGKGPVLVTSASRGRDLEGSVSLASLREIVDRRGAREGLTVMLDVCHAAQGDTRSASPLALGAEVAEAAQGGAYAVSDRVILAAAPGQAAYQTKLGRSEQGALSFSTSLVAGQWRKNPTGGLDVSYGDLVRRAGDVLGALSVPQKPTLVAPSWVEGTTFLGKGPAKGERARLVPCQVDGGSLVWRKYTMTISGNVTFGEILVINQAAGGFSAGTDRWSIYTSAISSLATASSLSFSYTDGNGTLPTLGGNQNFDIYPSLSWVNFTTDPAGGSGYLFNSGGTGAGALYFRIITGGTPVKMTRMAWYRITTSASAPADATPGRLGAVSNGGITVPANTYGWDIDYTTP